MTRVPRGGRSKPNPERPWRWACPECGYWVYRSTSDTRYYCRECGVSFEKDELLDRRE